MFEELANRRVEEIQDLNEETDFNNLTCNYKGDTPSKHFTDFKDPLNFYDDIKEGRITLKKAEEIQEQFRLEYNEIVKGSKKLLQILPIARAQVKAGNISENLLNGIKQIIYSLYRITKKVYNNIMNSIKV